MKTFITLAALCFIIVFANAAALHDIEQVHPSKEYRNFKEFLEKCLEKEVLQYSVRPLTKPGDNYGSMLQVIEVKSMRGNDSNEIDVLQLVAKTTLPGTISPTHSDQFLHEIDFYAQIVPAIEQFERSANIPETERIDAFARYYGSRISLDHEATNADADAVIVFENLNTNNFISPNRWIGFDKAEVLAILKKLAKLHALCIAMRRLQPNMFHSKVDPYVHTIYNVYNVELKIALVEKFVKIIPINFPKMPTSEGIAIENALTISKDYLRRTDRIPDTPYTTIQHRDVWSKNFMLKKDGIATNEIQVKIVDFQVYFYGSFVSDLILFLLPNADVDDLRADFKSFIAFYHSEFVKTMALVDCPLDDYTYEKMWNEVKDKAKINLLRVYSYLAFDQLKVPKNTTTPLESGEHPGDVYLNEPSPEFILNRWKCINDLYLENGFY